MTTHKSWWVRVNEISVISTGRGTAWWISFRRAAEPAGRIHIEQPSWIGDVVRVACDDREHADWLAAHMHATAGLPKSAVKVVHA